MAKVKKAYFCKNCGFEAPKWLGKCPACGEWNSFTEEIIAKESGNVIKLEHNQFVSTNRNVAVELRITMEAFGTEHKNQIIAALERENYQPKVVATSI